jgi:hypothetical protein
MPQLDRDSVARCVETFRLARVSGAMGVLHRGPYDAARLNAFARGGIERAAFMSRVSVEFRRERTDR